MTKIAIPVLSEEWTNYIKALKGVGAEAVLISEVCDASDFDGLLLPGGGDISPALYHQENKGSNHIHEELDRLQLAMLDCFVKAEKPVLGICRGHQLINVYFGGTLLQDIHSDIRHSDFQAGIEQFHLISCVSDSCLKQMYGDRFRVNSTHHQAVDRIGEGLCVLARADDGIIEALQHASDRILSVQFHPERLCFEKKREDTIDGKDIFTRFISECEK